MLSVPFRETFPRRAVFQRPRRMGTRPRSRWRIRPDRSDHPRSTRACRLGSRPNGSNSVPEAPPVTIGSIGASISPAQDEEQSHRRLSSVRPRFEPRRHAADACRGRDSATRHARRRPAVRLGCVRYPAGCPATHRRRRDSAGDARRRSRERGVARVHDLGSFQRPPWVAVGSRAGPSDRRARMAPES